MFQLDISPIKYVRLCIGLVEIALWFVSKLGQSLNREIIKV